MEEARALAASSRGAMVAAAGCGKTHVIATAVARHSSGTELVLTHTHAGVDALRARMRKLNVPSGRCVIETLAGWALRVASAFPRRSALVNPMPRESADYTDVYRAATRLCACRPFVEVLRASYSGVYVDEYQDCTLDQHALVLALAESLPCRIVGDPMQAIFGFGDNEVVSWTDHVNPYFQAVAGPSTPSRWKDSNPALGKWLREARRKLDDGEPLDLRRAPVRWVRASTPDEKRVGQVRACFDAAGKSNDRVVAIHGVGPQCRKTASTLRGTFSCVEAIDCEDLFKHAESIASASGNARAVAVFDFAASYLTQLSSPLAGVRQALAEDRTPRGKKYAAQQDALRAVADASTLAAVEAALDALSRVPDAVNYRRELLHEMRRALRALVAGDAPTLRDAVWLVRNQTRHAGRRLPRCAMATTLLVKGLEFDHAVVLDGDAHDKENLYVALTRGSGSLTVVSRTPIIGPRS